ncbi:DNA mismatch repair protein MutL-like isoform X2 [Linepithema humile]|uniref:DNA mismatch repair protein MutL-like isoform X2 n=1 Tax=Linepithema humile TaxID=83485 RepID=UPI00351E8390
MMRNKVELNVKAFTKSSFMQCLTELVASSLTAHAKAIAIRIHVEKRNVQVIDNGVGIPKDMLEHMTELNNQVLTSIRCLSDSFTIASRYQHSMETFMKVFKADSASNLTQIEQRPSCGTTVSVFDFHKVPQKWDISTICFFIGAIAVAKLEVSFSIRDEERSKVVLRIAKPHSSTAVLKMLFGKDLPLSHVWSIQCSSEYNTDYHGYIGISEKNATQWIFLNHKPIYCPLILKLIKIAFKERLNLPFDLEGIHDKNIFILFFLTFPENKFMFIAENGKRCVIFYDMQQILNNVKNCVFKCLSEDTSSAATPYLCKTQLLRQIYLKSERSVFNNNNINEHNENITSLMTEDKIVRIDFERKKITSTIVTNYSVKQRNKNDDIKAASCHIRKKNSSRCRINIASTKLHAEENLCKDVVSPLSEWSNWTYYTNTKERRSARNMCDTSKNNTRQIFKCAEQFDFLPRKLHGLLQYRHAKLTDVKCFNSPNDALSFTENWRHEHSLGTVHPCNLRQKLCEFRLSRAALECINTINQVNNEFIAAWLKYNEMKILLMIDQHAVHERIRYENLLLRYKMQNEDELLSVNLRDPLAVEFPKHMRNLLLRDKMLLKKYGISLGSLKKNTLLIRTVPQCLVTNNDYSNSEKILPKIHSLLLDILKNRDTTHRSNILPLTIHNAIASEACHGTRQHVLLLFIISEGLPEYIIVSKIITSKINVNYHYIFKCHGFISNYFIIYFFILSHRCHQIW